MAKAKEQLCTVFCRCCGVNHAALKGLETDKAIQMAWWELENLIKGVGCPVCHGNTPKYIFDMPGMDRAHVCEGLEIQWMESVRKACPKTQPYPAFPVPEIPDFFLWIEPQEEDRYAKLDPEIYDLIRSLEGGSAELRLHPEHLESEFEDFKYGVWHVFSNAHVDFSAETSSIRCLNAILLTEIFAGKTDAIGGFVWVRIAHDRDGKITVDLETLDRLVRAEQMIRKFGVLTPAIWESLVEK